MIMNKCLSLSLVFALLAGASSEAGAAPARLAIAVLVPVHYGSDESAKRVVRENCELEKTVEGELVESLGAEGRAVSTTQSSVGGRVLEASIESVEGLGGGAFTGYKSLSLKVRIYDGGRRVHSTMQGATSKGFLVGPGTCSQLAHAATKASRQIAKWLDGVDQVDASKPAASGAGD